MVGDILAKWGELDTLVNNAGIWTYLEMGRMVDAVYHETIGVNLDGVFYGIDAVVPAMKENGRGWIVNVDLHGRRAGRGPALPLRGQQGGPARPDQVPGRGAGPRTASGSTPSPRAGRIPTCARNPSASPVSGRSVRQSIPLKRIPPPEDIAGPILFLASDLARHITGAILNVNGGSVLCGG